MEDIENILQQYGVDRRQQQDATNRIMHLARRQRTVVAAMSCIAVLLLTTVLTARRLTTPQPAENVTIARQSRPMPNIDAPQQTFVTVTDGTSSVTSTQKSVVGKANKKSPVVPVLQVDNYEETNIAQYSEQPSVQETDSSNSQILPTEQATPPFHIYNSLLTNDNSQNIDFYNQSFDHPTTDSDGRLNFTASVGAFAMSRYGLDASEVVSITGVGVSNMSYTVAAPLNSFSANMGMTYTVLKKEKVSSHVGLVLCGQAQQGEIVYYNLEPISGNGVEGFVYQMVENTDERQSYSTFSLYAGVPIIVDLQPSGSNEVGWSLSLTPAHTVFTPSSLGGVNSDVFVPNPWKLTLGVGVSLPRRFLRRISVTANLLSISKSMSLHEVGIEIGF